MRKVEFREERVEEQSPGGGSGRCQEPGAGGRSDLGNRIVRLSGGNPRTAEGRKVFRETEPALSLQIH